MITVYNLGPMKATPEQYKAAEKILKNNTSMRWDGKFGHFSNGCVSMSIYWNFDKPKRIYHITLNPDGTENID